MNRRRNALHIFQSKGTGFIRQSVYTYDNQRYNDKNCHPHNIRIRKASRHLFLIHRQTPPLPHFPVCA